MPRYALSIARFIGVDVIMTADKPTGFELLQDPRPADERPVSHAGIEILRDRIRKHVYPIVKEEEGGRKRKGGRRKKEQGERREVSEEGRGKVGESDGRPLFNMVMWHSV